jgi:hypothetical protein
LARSSLAILFDFFPLHAHAVNQVEEQERHQRKCENGEIGVEIPQSRDDDVTVVGQIRDLREYLLIGQTEDNGAREEAKQTRDQVIQFSFAGPGDTGAWSVTG